MQNLGINTIFALMLALFLASGALAAEVYKWVDESGNVHYSDQPPTTCEPERIAVAPPPTEEEAQQARERHQAVLDELTRGDEARTRESGRLPDNVSSEYLQTLGIGWTHRLEGKKPMVTYSLHLRPKPGLPNSAYLEAHFEDPATGEFSIVVGKRCEGKDRILILSPPIEQLRCGYYLAIVDVYSDETKETKLGEHRQLSLSLTDTREIETVEQFAEAMVRPGSTCRGLKTSSFERLEQQGLFEIKHVPRLHATVFVPTGWHYREESADEDHVAVFISKENIQQAGEYETGVSINATFNDRHAAGSVFNTVQRLASQYGADVDAEQIGDTYIARTEYELFNPSSQKMLRVKMAGIGSAEKQFGYLAIFESPIADWEVNWPIGRRTFDLRLDQLSQTD